MLTFGLNGVTDTNVFLPTVNASVDAEVNPNARCEKRLTLYGDVERVSQPVSLVPGYHLLGALYQRLSIRLKLFLHANIANLSD